MRITFLGTGTSFGVPQLGCDCQVCRSTDPRDKRGRTSALIEVRGDGGEGGEGGLPPAPTAPAPTAPGPTHTILIDTPPELRLSLLAAGATRIDTVLYTHEHADHLGGIDDLRIFSLRQRGAIPTFASARTIEFLRASYRYIFDDRAVPVPGTSKPQLSLHPIEPGTPFVRGPVEILPLEFEHGNTPVMGFRIGRLAYLTDVKAVGTAAREALAGLDLLVLNALWWRPHPTHLSIPEAIATAQALGARRTILTHLTHETGHAELAAALPSGIEPGYDGLTVEVPE